MNPLSCVIVTILYCLGVICKGCYQLNSGDEFIVSTLGECRRTTDCKTFGINNSTAGLRCKCASNNATQIHACGEKCREADQYPCGGTADTNIFSFYTVENAPPSDHSQDIHKNCLLFYYKKKPGIDYYWESCRFTTPTLLCSSKYFSDYNPMAEINNESDELWANAVEKCVAGGKFPASIQSITNVNFTDKNAQDYWTGIIKTESIISLNDMLDNSTYPPLSYAYVEKMNQTVYVRFAKKGDSKKSLCVGDGTSAGPTITTRETQPSYSESTTTPAKRSTAGLAAGLSVSLVVLIIVTVIVLVLLKRRELLTKCYKPSCEKSSHTEDTATEISCISTPIFQSTTNTTNDLNDTSHSYFVLEKTFDEETKEETEHYAEPDTTDGDHYDLTEKSKKDTDNDYDTANGKRSSAKSGLAKPNNSYNKVTLHQTNEYDHINGRLPKSDRQTENEYDISNNLINGKGNTNFGDDSDTYNHLNKHESKSSDTDNVYGN